MPDNVTADPGYLGLTRMERSLPASWYLDEDHFQRELRAIWYRQWIYVDRADSLPSPGDYRLVSIGDQRIILLRDASGTFRAYHNTCRHRGAELLAEPCGNIARNIVCPYHGWSYGQDGTLQRAPSSFRQAGFDEAELGLYPVAVEEWRGLLFINLDPEAPPVAEGMDFKGQALANWPLEALRCGHEFREEIACNWKVFWENFNECLHCPGIHPELSDLVPLYRRRLMEVKDDPQWQQHQAAADERFRPGLREGALTWSADGQPCDSPFPDLSPEEVQRGHTFEVLLPTMFMVGHIDYVRVVRLTPLSVDRTELRAQWFFREETLARDDFRASEFANYARLVLRQDARAAEMNQRGLRCIAHDHGVLMAEEYEVLAFQRWVIEQLARGDTGN